MALKVPNLSEVAVLQNLVAYLNTLTLRLFKNDYTPLATDTVANYTEANFTGYAAINTNSWGVAFLNAANKGETDEIARTFTQTGVGVTNTVYGYYVTTGAGALVFAERNPAGGVAMDTAGKTYTVLPRFTLDSES